MDYRPIEPIEAPNDIHGSQPLQYRISTFPIGIVTLESRVWCSGVKTQDPSVFAVRPTAQHQRLNREPLKLRHNGDTIDLELWVDQFGVAPDDLVTIAPALYPPAEPLEFSIPLGTPWFRSTSLYGFVGIPVPKASSLVWDGRAAVTVDLEGKAISPLDRVQPLRDSVSQILNTSRTPTFVMGTGLYGKTSSLPSEDFSVDSFHNSIARFLATHYNADDIPPAPLSLDSSGPVVVGINTIVAVLDGPYFVEWRSQYVQ